ncbi:Putative G-protein coupled receptor 144 [Fukomys damarensis]|uniref:Putative G-protein coupled receptor 144 n=1 Tax=Fukomys damarensis TaxID=885580 RepID=A0A091CL36_FUKDA|nr:Putative G-protein coupled receptor 144 [Fukomys damarensis]
MQRGKQRGLRSKVSLALPPTSQLNRGTLGPQVDPVDPGEVVETKDVICKFPGQRLSWWEAQESCEQRFGHLALGPPDEVLVPQLRDAVWLGQRETILRRPPRRQTYWQLQDVQSWPGQDVISRVNALAEDTVLLSDPLSEAPGPLSLDKACSFLSILERVLVQEPTLGPAALLAVLCFLKRASALGAGEPEPLEGPWEQLGRGIMSVISLVLEEQLAGVWLSIPKRGPEEESLLRTLSFVGCGVSFCALATTFSLFLVAGTPKSERTTVHKNLTFSLASAEGFLMASEWAKTNQVACVAVTAAMHFLFLVVSWMLVEGLLLWSKVVAVSMRPGPGMRLYYAAGWGAPVVIVAVTLATSPADYTTAGHCWLNVHTDAIWAFAGPVPFVLAAWGVDPREPPMLHPALSTFHRATVKPVLVLLPILGLTWLAGILVHLSPAWAYATVGLNSLQGPYIFLVYAACNREVRSALQRVTEKKVVLAVASGDPTPWPAPPRCAPRTTLQPGVPQEDMWLSEVWPYHPARPQFPPCVGRAGRTIHPVSLFVRQETEA